MMKLHEYIRNMLVFFNSKFLIENNEVKANAVLTLISQWDKLIDRINNLDASAPKLAALIKAEFHAFILQIKRNKNIFTSNDKRLILSLVVLLQAVRTKDIKGLLLTNLIDYTYCMTNDGGDGSEISSIFEYDEDYIEHSTTPLVEHLTDLYERQFWENAHIENLTPVEAHLGPLFDYLTHQSVEHMEHFPDFDNQPLAIKIKALQNAYFTESIEKAVIHDALNKQTDQLFRRHESLLDAKETIKSLTQENLELKRQINELMENIRK